LLGPSSIRPPPSCTPGTWGQVAESLTGLIWAARTDRGQGWAADRAAELLALLDGLAIAVLVEPERMPADRARRLAAAAVARVLSEPSAG